MDKAIAILLGMIFFIAYVNVLFVVGFLFSCKPHNYDENISSAYVVSCVLNAGITVALLVENGVLAW